MPHHTHMEEKIIPIPTLILTPGSKENSIFRHNIPTGLSRTVTTSLSGWTGLGKDRGREIYIYITPEPGATCDRLLIHFSSLCFRAIIFFVHLFFHCFRLLFPCFFVFFFCFFFVFFLLFFCFFSVFSCFFVFFFCFSMFFPCSFIVFHSVDIFQQF